MFNYNKFEQQLKQYHKQELGKEIHQINSLIRREKYKKWQTSHDERLNRFVKSMDEQPIQINN
jgi:hypothetical protein